MPSVEFRSVTDRAFYLFHRTDLELCLNSSDAFDCVMTGRFRLLAVRWTYVVKFVKTSPLFLESSPGVAQYTALHTPPSSQSSVIFSFPLPSKSFSCILIRQNEKRASPQVRNRGNNINDFKTFFFPSLSC